MSFATDGGVVAADGGVETLNVSMNAVGKVGIFLQVNSVVLPVCEHGLSGSGELEGLLLPFLVAADVLELDAVGTEPFCDVLEVLEAAEGVRGVFEIAVDVGAGLLDAEVLPEIANPAAFSAMLTRLSPAIAAKFSTSVPAGCTLNENGAASFGPAASRFRQAST